MQHLERKNRKEEDVVGAVENHAFVSTSALSYIRTARRICFIVRSEVVVEQTSMLRKHEQKLNNF
jgi:hypothetical protein